MINLRANDELKKLGCKWSGTKWEAPELAEAEAEAINKKYYDDLIAIEVTSNEDKKCLPGMDWGYKHVKMVAGYIIATVSGRDSGASIQPGVAVIDGNFSSSGSRKNYYCAQSTNLKIRLKVSRNVLDILDEEVAENRYTYKILNIETKNTLQKRKDDLLKQLQEVENKLNESEGL